MQPGPPLALKSVLVKLSARGNFFPTLVFTRCTARVNSGVNKAIKATRSSEACQEGDLRYGLILKSYLIELTLKSMPGPFFFFMRVAFWFPILALAAGVPPEY
jgi:hypothetical protein